MSWTTAARRRWPSFLSCLILLCCCALFPSLSPSCIRNLWPLGKDASSANHRRPRVWPREPDTTRADLSGHGLWPHTHHQWHLQVKPLVSFYMPPLCKVDRQLIGQSVIGRVSWPFDWSVSHLSSQLIWSFSQPIDLTLISLVAQAVIRLLSRSSNWSVVRLAGQLAIWLVGQLFDLSLSQPFDWSVSPLIGHSFH